MVSPYQYLIVAYIWNSLPKTLTLFCLENDMYKKFYFSKFGFIHVLLFLVIQAVKYKDEFPLINNNTQDPMARNIYKEEYEITFKQASICRLFGSISVS